MIYLCRNAKDVAVSYYYFFKMVAGHPNPGTFQEFVEKFMDGQGNNSVVSFNSFKVNDSRQIASLSKNFCCLSWFIIPDP